MVAIIAVLVAISIPVFNAQLEKSRDATDQANLRAAYAEAVAAYMTGENVAEADAGYTYTKSTRTFTKKVPQKGTNNKWGDGSEEFKIGGKTITPGTAANSGASFEIVFNDNGEVTTMTWGGSSGGGTGGTGGTDGSGGSGS